LPKYNLVPHLTTFTLQKKVSKSVNLTEMNILCYWRFQVFMAVQF